MTTRNPPICVVGAGVIGLATTLLLSNAGHRVTIVARDFPGDNNTDWSSPWAGALLAPHPDGDRELQRSSLEYYKTLLNQKCLVGLASLPIEEYYDDRDNDSTIWYRDYVGDFTLIESHKLPAKARLGFRYTGLVVDPNRFLPWLAAKLKARGVVFVRKNLKSLEEARSLSRAGLVVNASGLGASKLANDDKVFAARGQTLCVSGPYDKAMILQGSEYTYVIPRPYSKQIILGGVRQVDSQTPAPLEEIRSDILRRVKILTDGAFAPNEIQERIDGDTVGFRPGREGGLRVEQVGSVIHAYGADGFGFLYCFGVAQKVCELVDESAIKSPL